MDNKKFYRIFCETKHGRHGYLTSYFVDVLAESFTEVKKEPDAIKWFESREINVF